MKQSPARIIDNEEDIIIQCEYCSQKLRIPKRKNKLIVTCPKCRHEFRYRYFAFGLSSSSQKPLYVGLVGGLVGFLVVETLESAHLFTGVSFVSALFSVLLVTGAYGLCLGACMGASEGVFRKNQVKLFYGLRVGSILGLISGVISGFFAQLAFYGILYLASLGSGPNIVLIMIARIVGWSILGLLIGLSYGIKENTLGDVKYGLIGGAIGGAVGGLLFDPITSLIQIGDGTFGRLAGFTVLGSAISTSVNRFREVAIANNKPEMYKMLTDKLPVNSRFLLPESHPGNKFK